jgi:phospholipid N-methyltransferase
MMASSPALTDVGRHVVADYVEFVAAWIRNPLQTASVLPSSRYLAALIVQGLKPDGGRVIELGGGTGVFTRAILGLGIAPADLEVVEINHDLARQLRASFPDVSVIEADAGQLSHHVAAPASTYQAVISGLPLLAMRRAQQRGILAEAFALLADDGAMYQFTYSTKCPVCADMLAELGLVSEETGFTWRNFPPARVFRFSREPAAVGA